MSDDEDLDALLAEIDQLEDENETLETEATGLNKQLKSLTARAGTLVSETEMEEEHIANGLFRRMDGLRDEKHRLQNILEVEEQEAKDIVQRIAEVRQRRVELENKLEVEQEAQMNRLHKSLLDLAVDKSNLEKKLHNERTAYLMELHSRISTLGAASPPLGGGADPASPITPGAPSQSDSVTELRIEIERLLNMERDRLGIESDDLSSLTEKLNALHAQHEKQLLQAQKNDGGDNSGASAVAAGADVDETLPSSPTTASQYENLIATLRQLQMDRILVKNKAERVREQLEKAQADLIFETELQQRLAREAAGGEGGGEGDEGSIAIEGDLESFASASGYTSNSNMNNSSNHQIGDSYNSSVTGASGGGLMIGASMGSNNGGGGGGGGGSSAGLRAPRPHSQMSDLSSSDAGSSLSAERARIAKDPRNIRAHTHRLLNTTGTPTPTVHRDSAGGGGGVSGSRRTPPRTPPESTRSHSSRGGGDDRIATSASRRSTQQQQ